MDLRICPDRGVLTEYVLGTIALDELEPLAAHVRECPHCEETVANLETSTDAVIEKLRRPAPRDLFADEDACRRAVAAIEAIGGDTVEPGPVTVPTWLPPQQIGQYQILEEIGRGGMGIVYKALHRQLEKVVALKVLRSERLQGEQALSRFQREMRSVGKLDHPHIVRATDAGEVDGLHFLVMEFVDGIDIAALSRERGQLRIGDACEIIRQAALGLQEAHVHGMVHRDIKPSNLMLARTLRGSQPPTVKILDLGLALLDDRHGAGHELTETGQAMGTLDFMAPEQADDSHTVDIRADIYSLGATLYKLLTGQAPFGGEEYATRMQKFTALATAPAPPIIDKRPDVPTGLQEIVHRMLAKDMGARFSTPVEVAEALQRYCAGHNLAALLQESPNKDIGGKLTEPAAPAPTVAATKSARANTKTPRRWPFGITAAILLVLLGTLLVALLQSTQQPNGGSSDPNYQAVKWALSIGGTVHVVETNQGEEIKWQISSVEELPAGSYTLDVTLPATDGRTPDKLVKLTDAKKITRLKLLDVSDDGLAAIAQMNQLRHLALRPHGQNFVGNTKLTNDGMKHLAGLENLESISICSGAAQDQSLSNLSKLENLRSLTLYMTEITDDGLIHLQKLSQLEELRIGFAKITDHGLQHLRSMSKLRRLNFPSCKSVTGAGLSELPELKNLETLGLNRTSADDIGLDQVGRFVGLAMLNLESTRVTNNGLQQLWNRLPNLSSVDLRNNPQLTDQSIEVWTKRTLPQFIFLEKTGVTALAIAKLQTASPHRIVHSDYRKEDIDQMIAKIKKGEFKHTEKK